MNTGTHYVSLDMEADDIPDDEFTPMLDFTPGLRRIPSYAENETIINQLVQMNFSLRAAMLCVQITEANDLETVFQFITSDDYGFYNHPYIEQENSSICIICSDIKQRHVDSLDAKQFEQARRPPQGSNKTAYISLENTHDLAEVEVFKRKPIIDPVSCMVCFDDIERSEIITFDSKLHDICPKCFTEYLETQIKENKVLKIVCPHCSEELREETIKTLVSEDIYNKFKRFVRNIKINCDPLSKWCPNPTCSEVITLKSKNAQKGKCEHCRTEICGKCGRNFHGRSSCEKQVDKDLRTFLNSKDSSKCPKCGMYVWKDSGCNHMTCVVCAYEWCWLCGSAYTKFHFMNPFGCLGLQDGNYTAKNWGCLKRTFYRLGIILGILIALPFIALIGFPIYFCIMVSESACYQNSVGSEGCCCNIFYFVFFVFPLGLLLNLIVLPVALFCLPFALLGYIILYCYERCKLMQRAREGLRAHRQRRQSA